MIAATPFVYAPEAYNETNIMLTTFQVGNKIIMRANVTNQGGDPITSVTLNLTDSNDNSIYNNQAMTDNQDTCPGPATCDVYEKNYTLQAADPIGIWWINVTASDGTDLSYNSSSFVVSVGWLNVTLLEPDPITYTDSNPRIWTLYRTYLITSKIECMDGNCGNVNATVRYNKSSANPDTGINKTEGATPFYILLNQTIVPIAETHKAYKVGTTTGTNPGSATTEFTDANYNSVNKTDDSRVSTTATLPYSSCAGGVSCLLIETNPPCQDTCGCNWDGTSCSGSASCSGLGQSACETCAGCSEDYSGTKYTHFNFIFNLSSLDVDSIQNITYYFEGYYSKTASETYAAYTQFYNSSGWFNDSNIGTTEATYTRSFTSGFSDLVIGGKFTFGATGNVTSDNNQASITLHADYVKLEVETNETGIKSCGTMSQGDTCLLNWTVNITGTPDTYWKVGVKANSSYTSIADNHTKNATVKITSPARLEVSLIYPPDNTYVEQNTTFNVNATVTCRDGPCGIVWGTVMYNDTDLNTTKGDIPFYNTSGSSLQSCGSLSQDQSCQMNWTVNATGDYTSPGNEWEIGVFFNASYSTVSDNHTDNATIKIIECTESMTLTWNSISFTNLDPNTAGSSNPATGNTNDLYNITNTGTCTLKVWINATDLENTTYNTKIGIGNLTWNNRSNDFSTSYTMTNTYDLLNSSFTPAIYNITTYYWLAIPPIKAGRYVGNMTFCWNTSQQSGESDTCTT